ncbi:VanZ family protein [Flavobacterium sp. NST-5]|uniref:VanZ family protein n=1 Tax=Flavobacterium ichthyis TaxID=2698827 RepID=A0ABW9ZFK1_9FLAO|nr:VanZ family protein [Flavobacterium ichthyis]
MAIVVACLVDWSKIPTISTHQHTDKIAHFVFYAVFASLWFLYFKQSIKNQRKLFVIVFLFAFLFGLIIEICQDLFTETRHADIQDAIANTLGALFGLLIMITIFRKK